MTRLRPLRAFPLAFIFALLVLAQCVAPFVHDHIGGQHFGGRMHVHLAVVEGNAAAGARGDHDSARALEYREIGIGQSIQRRSPALPVPGVWVLPHAPVTVVAPALVTLPAITPGLDTPARLVDRTLPPLAHAPPVPLAAA